MRIVLLCFSLLFFPVFGNEPKICLSMTVKNDEAVILRCLNSVKNLVDCIYICERESEDSTVLLIEQFMYDNNIPHLIHHWTKKNGNYNSNFLIEKTQETLNTHFQLPLDSTYILILDACDELAVDSRFSKEFLTADTYLFLKTFTDLSYSEYSPRLFRASSPVKSEGEIYEHWVVDSPMTEKLPLLAITHSNSPYEKKAKLEENLTLLSQAFKARPNPRFLFYLGQTNYALERYQEAIQWHKESLDKEESREKAWLSRLILGECYEKLEQWEKALFWYLDAYQFDPDRPDPLYKISIYYRLKGKNDLAYLFAKQGSRIPYPHDSPIPPLADYRFDEELSISAYYTPFKNEGFMAADDLILKKEVPSYLKQNTYRNLLFYIENLPNTALIPIAIDFPYITEGLEDRYNPMNPSIQKTAGGYKVICRTVNYTQQGAKTFHTVDPDGIFRTRNFLIDYSPDFNIVSSREIIENLPRERTRTFSLEGLDDCRIFEYKNQSWFTCTTGDTNPYGNFQISLCQLGEPDSLKTVPVKNLTPLQGPDPYRCEKNWLPFVKKSELYLIYSYSPFIIYKPDTTTGECEIAFYGDPPYDFSSFRGSAAPIDWDDGYLMLVHEVTLFSDASRCYFHRFVYLNKQFQVQKVSLPFTFQHKGVEYCCSMTLDHSETQLILPIGIEDREAYLCFVDVDTVRSLLKNLPEITSRL